MVVQTKKSIGIMYIIASILLGIFYISQRGGSEFFSDFSIYLVAASAVLFFVIGLLVMMKMRGQRTTSRMILGLFALYYFEGAYISFQNDMIIRGILLVVVTIFWTWYVDRGINVLSDPEHEKRVEERKARRAAKHNMSTAH